MNKSSIDSTINNLFSQLITESSQIVFKPQDNIPGKYSETISSYGLGIHCLHSNGHTFLDFRKHQREDILGHMHPLILKAKLLTASKPNALTNIEKSELFLIQRQLHNILSPLGRWVSRVAKHRSAFEHDLTKNKKHTLINCHQIFSHQEIKRQIESHGLDNVALYNFNPLYHIHLLDQDLAYIYCNDFLPLPIEILPFQNITDVNTLDYSITHYDYLISKSILKLFQETEFLSPGMKVHQQLELIHELELTFEQHDKITFETTGLSFSLKAKSDILARQLHKYLWKRGILSVCQKSRITFYVSTSCTLDQLAYLSDSISREIEKL